MKRIYITPSIELIPSQLECNLLQASQAEGGHTPGVIGSPISGAKQGFYDDEVEDIKSTTFKY